MRIGVLGGGQLGRMLALAGIPMGFRFVFLDPAEDACAREVGQHIAAPFDDPAALDRLAKSCDVVTYEFENVAIEAAEAMACDGVLLPPPAALAVSQDRVAEKSALRDLGIPTARFASIDSLDALRAAAKHLGFPCVLKTRRFGYDGKGQEVLRAAEELAAAWGRLGASPGGLVLEAFAPFQRELSLVGARGRDGSTAFHPLVENIHRDGILRETIAPARGVDPAMQRHAEEAATALMESLDYAGVLAIEWFEVDGRLLANEIAPRVHNTGHWTIEGAATSQFEQHLRAIAGLPLGPAEAVGHSRMLNAIGRMPRRGSVLAIPCARLHDYGKPPRPGRKVGHATVRADTPEAADAAADALRALMDG